VGPSKGYADIARGIEGFLNIQPLLNSIQDILNGYFPPAYLIAFVLLVVGTMREFLFPETRRFMQNLLRAVLLVAAISFLPSFMNWSYQGNYEEKYRKLPTKLPIFPTFSTDFHHKGARVDLDRLSKLIREALA
jgi:hypothetical protein